MSFCRLGLRSSRAHEREFGHVYLLVAPAHSISLTATRHRSANLGSPVCDARVRSPQSYPIRSASMVD